MAHQEDISCYLSHLPTEIIFLIIEYLSQSDKIAFNFAYHRFFCQQRCIKTLDSFHVSRERVDQLLLLHTNTEIITKLDFSYCYWIPSGLLLSITLKCPSLEVLLVSHSNLNCSHLAQLLHEDSKISQLSFSITRPKEFWKDGAIPYVKQFKNEMLLPDTDRLWCQSCLSQCRPALIKLTSLDIHFIHQDSLILETLLSVCTSLENVCLRFDSLQEFNPVRTRQRKLLRRISEADSMQDEIKKGSSSILHSLTVDNLKSFIVVFNNGTGCLNAEMENVIRRIIRGIKCDDLQTFWTPLACPAWDSVFNSAQIRKILDWKQLNRYSYSSGGFLPSDLNDAKSLVWNPYMQKGVFLSPKLKKTECGFWKDHLPRFCQAHPQLKKIRFNKRPTDHFEVLYSVIDWIPLPSKLKVLSLHPKILRAADYMQDSIRIRKYVEDGGNVTYRRSLSLLLEACPLLEELEICPDLDEIHNASLCKCMDSFIHADSLFGLSSCPKLKKFSLNNVNIAFRQDETDDPSILEEILYLCPNLEEFRLQNVNHSVIHDLSNRFKQVDLLNLNEQCIQRCCQALQSAKRLRLLRWKLHFYFPIEHLIFSVAHCTSLVQLGLILPSGQERTILFGWTEEAIANLFLKLVEQLPKIVALLVVLPTVPASYCATATATLKAQITPTRPCFTTQITHSLQSASPAPLPRVHYQALAAHACSTFSDFPHHLDSDNA